MPKGIYKRVKPISEIAKRKISKTLTGRKRPPFSKKWKINIGLGGIGKHLRETNPRWKGGTKKHHLGYIMINSPKHPFKGKYGYVMKHRLVMEKIIGRYLKPNEMIHHINEIRNDNRPENLTLCANRKAHNQIPHLKNKPLFHKKP